jgi:hypothetical protein
VLSCSGGCGLGSQGSWGAWVEDNFRQPSGLSEGVGRRPGWQWETQGVGRLMRWASTPTEAASWLGVMDMGSKRLSQAAASDDERQ